MASSGLDLFGNRRLTGIDLFSGIGGLASGLRDYVNPILYCESDAYCQAVLLHRFLDGRLEEAPIWDDVRTLQGRELPNLVDIIYGGFPCQDISVAGRGAGLEGERSGLFFEILRLAKDVQPPFLFLENVPCITSRGGIRAVKEIATLGYDCRWLVISASSVGAYHKRDRWFLLAYSKHAGPFTSAFGRGAATSVRRSAEGQNEASKLEGIYSAGNVAEVSVSNAYGKRILDGNNKRERLQSSNGIRERPASNDTSLRCDERSGEGIRSERKAEQPAQSSDFRRKILNYWEDSEPPLCGVAHGTPHRAHRIKALGNACVPQQAKEAFEILLGIKKEDTQNKERAIRAIMNSTEVSRE